MRGGEATFLILTLIAVLLAIIPVLVIGRNNKIVNRDSRALVAVRPLNEQYRHLLTRFPPIRHTFAETVNSKAKLERYDMSTLLLENLARMEATIQSEIDIRLAAIANFTRYSIDYDRIGTAWLGRSTSEKLRDEKFARVEIKLFAKSKLRVPQCAAKVRYAVTYTSPKGKNSYAKGGVLNFEQLCQWLEEMRQTRERQASAQFLRSRERNRMTDALRYEILRRDGHRCKACGSSADDGPLHVDHIVPVSKGGATTRENLQTLCQACNLGKSNRF